MQNETLVCPNNLRYSVVLDASEAYPADPGSGTPAMVYGPGDVSATFFCALDTGELDGTHTLPPAVHRWLEDVAEQVDRFVNKAFDAAKARDKIATA